MGTQAQRTVKAFAELDGRRLTVLPRAELRRKGAWRGAIVRTRERVRNTRGGMPAGTLWQVLRNYGGLELLSLPCRRCGFRLEITKVGEHEVDYLGHVMGRDGDILSW